MLAADPNPAVIYEKVNADIQQKWFSTLLSRVKIMPGSKCLDIGCGTGNNTATLADLVGDNGHVTGIDPDERRIEVANEKSKRGNIDYILGKGIDIPMCDSGYDLIVSNAVMHWVNYDERVETYRRVLSVLKNGGVLAICECSSLSDIYYQFISFFTEEERAYFQNGFHLLTAEKNMEIFQSLGFEIVQIEKVVEENTCASLDSYFEWFGATVYGKINPAKIYEENREKIHVELNEDGSLTTKRDITYIIVKK